MVIQPMWMFLSDCSSSSSSRDVEKKTPRGKNRLMLFNPKNRWSQTTLEALNYVNWINYSMGFSRIFLSSLSIQHTLNLSDAWASRDLWMEIMIQHLFLFLLFISPLDAIPRYDRKSILTLFLLAHW